MDNAKKIIKNDTVIQAIKPLLEGYNAYLVGGFVRDALLEETSPDKDIIVESDDVKNLAKSIAEKLDGHFVPLDEINNIYRVILPNKIDYIDLTAPVNGSLEEDILRRDLTINSIIYNINTQEFIDIAGGINDIKNKVIKGISEQNFLDDPLRLLRIYRFYSKLGFKIDENLIEITKKYRQLIQKPAKERVNLELSKLFEGKWAADALEKMYKTGLLEEILPVAKELEKIPPNSHHHLDLLDHSIEVVRQIQNNFEKADKEIREYLTNTTLGNTNLLGNLKIAGFLHDIGKPQTWTIEEDTGRHRFIRHDDIGSKLAPQILKELKFSKKQIAYISKLIKYHIYPANIVSMPNVTEKAFTKFYRKMEGIVIEVIILSMSDRLSALGPEITNDIVEKNLSGLTRLLNNYLATKEDMKPLEKLLDGNEIMEILNIKQSETLGKIIKELKEAQVSGDILTKEDAIKFIKNTTNLI